MAVMAVALSGLLLTNTVTVSAEALPTPCTEPAAQVASAAALRPADVLLAITSPRAGEMVYEPGLTQSVTVAVDYWGPRLVIPANAHAVDEYHLVYFLDVDASGYVGTMVSIPLCNPHVMHTSATEVTFDKVSHGSHVLSVMLVGSNNVSVNPPVAASISFVVK
jgi:hypothetical protein